MLAVLLLAGGLAALLALVSEARPPELAVPTSRLVLDREGRLLRPFTVADGRWRMPVDLAEVDPRLIAMLLAFEDRRFRSHAGVDPRALARAAGQMLSNGRIVSGASTITMQLARLLDGRSTRTPGGKLMQIATALALERRESKDAILTAYLTLAPYGGNIEGVRAASLAWFGKEPLRLTAAEAALLVAIPQTPEARRPDRHPETARRARDRVLARAAESGVISEDEARAARHEPVPRSRRSYPMLAAHAAERAVREHPERGVHRLTLDAGLQERLERLAAERAERLGGRVSVALLVADHRNGDILASVGSAGLLDTGRDGFIDMTRALRSPGSTLKPLIYGLAFEVGIAHPESLIEDRPAGFAGYVPTNFDRSFQGTVTVRRALQLSLNVPAVRLLDAVGPARLVARMKRAGAQPALPDLSPPGLAIGLGGVGVRLSDLVSLYAAIARNGRSLVLTQHWGDRTSVPEPRRVLDARAAWYVTSILAGVPPPAHAAPEQLAFKTGTSYGYRDAWAVGFDGRHVVGVWSGRPDGGAVPGLTGIAAAAPILVDAFARLGERTPLPRAPPGVLVASTAQLPPTLRHAGGGTAGAALSEDGPEIAFPRQGARVDLGLGAGSGQGLALKVRGGSPPFLWFANGAPVERAAFARTAVWEPDGPGFTTIAVVDGRGRSNRVSVFLQ
jgi:penicillin-binding protein 1C